MRRLENRGDPPGGSFTDDLEERASQLLECESTDDSQWSPSRMIEDDVALVLEQIHSVRKREEELMEELLTEECKVGTELLQMEHRTPRYSPYRFPEREKHQRRLDRFAAERRRIQAAHAQRLESLHERLLTLVGRWRQIKPPGSHPLGNW